MTIILSSIYIFLGLKRTGMPSTDSNTILVSTVNGFFHSAGRISYFNNNVERTTFISSIANLLPKIENFIKLSRSLIIMLNKKNIDNLTYRCNYEGLH